ncbi:MAG: DUF5680 domain-containing protein [Candidatus Diapherotrites archaeon]|nr:DUF5680 domain-containing protein [Candidatus Diapherotrites archaeon]
MDSLVKKLGEFLKEAVPNTYAGGAASVDPKYAEKGMKELTYSSKDGDFFYKDSYARFFKSFGREVVWFKGAPFWSQCYGGGMESEFHNNAEFAHETFSFLKKAMLAVDKASDFAPRGLKKFSEGKWDYLCNWKGDISSFFGEESISFEKKIVFRHWFVGGLFGYVPVK